MKRMVLKTPAKINLALDVVGKRADGYHTLETVFQTVSLYDTITVTLFPHRTGEQAIRILCNIPWIPKDERNIAWKAVDLFLKKTGCPVDFDIYLQKYIPSQAGLGGGSSDAAAVLYACNQLTGAGLSHAELCEMGLQLGADVPFSTAVRHMLPALAKKSNRFPIWAMYQLSLQREKAVSPQRLHMRQWMPCKIRHIQMFRR